MHPKFKVALCINLDDFYEHGIARGVVRWAKECGDWELFGYGWMFRSIRRLSQWQGHGIISRVETLREVKRLVALGLPVVDVAGAFVDAGFMQVTNDDHATGRAAAQHLQSRGLVGFAYCGVRNTGWSRQRQSGFASVLAKSGVRHFPVFERTLDWWERPDIATDLLDWLRRLALPCGVMACNDTAGLKLSRACEQLGLRIPTDIAVIGVDNEDVLCELANPSLSSIPCNCEKIGYESARTLHARMQGKPCPRRPLLVAPGRPIARASSDRLATSDPLVIAATRFIHGNIARGVNVNDVVAHVPTSRRNLEIRFRNEFGRSLHEEIKRSRLERAEHLLSETNMPIAKISHMCGFSSIQRFYRVFGQKFGMPPGSFRNQRPLKQ